MLCIQFNIYLKCSIHHTHLLTHSYAQLSLFLRDFISLLLQSKKKNLIQLPFYTGILSRWYIYRLNVTSVYIALLLPKIDL